MKESMPTLTIDGKSVSVPEGATILQAARQVGIAIPTLCYREDFPPNLSCMICAVRSTGFDRLVPACATAAVEGMAIQTRTDEVVANRRLVLTMLLSHHTGDCDAPCTVACPAGLDIPAMLRAMGRGDNQRAARLALDALVLPRTLGYVCPAPCENICRRGAHDGALAIPHMHLTAALRGGSAPESTQPESGRRIAVLGAGPAGLAAAFGLRRLGHTVHLYEESEAPGGMLRYGVEKDRLPAEALDADVAAIPALGVTCHLGVLVSDRADFESLRSAVDALVVATGARSDPGRWGLESGSSGVIVNRDTMATSVPGVFAAGGVIREIRRMAVRAVASGLTAAERVHQFLTRGSVSAPGKPINVSMGKLRDGEMARFLETAASSPRQAPTDVRAPLPASRISSETGRCLHCDCRARHDCTLRALATEYGADTRTWRDKRPPFEQDLSHPDVIYEPCKCIACGLCIRVAAAENEAYGQTFLGRGIAVRVGPPLRKTLVAALSRCAERCVEVCPTGALSWRDGRAR